jgi:hypothetical protein
MPHYPYPHSLQEKPNPPSYTQKQPSKISPPDALIRQNRPHQLGVVDLAGACVHRLEQFVNFFVGHLFAQVCEDVAQLADADESGHVFVEDLEAAAV